MIITLFSYVSDIELYRPGLTTSIEHPSNILIGSIKMADNSYRSG